MLCWPLWAYCTSIHGWYQISVEECFCIKSVKRARNPDPAESGACLLCITTPALSKNPLGFKRVRHGNCHPLSISGLCAKNWMYRMGHVAGRIKSVFVFFLHFYLTVALEDCLGGKPPYDNTSGDMW